MDGALYERLLYAAKIGDVDTLRALITSGVDVNAHPITGTALHEAVRWKGEEHGVEEEFHAAAIEFLLENGADPNIADHRGRTPLHSAALNANSFSIRRLLDAGADPNAKAIVQTDYLGGVGGGGVPLHSACTLEKQDSAACVQMLIQAGARVDEENDIGETPLFISMIRRDGTLVKLLLRAGAKIEGAREVALSRRRGPSRANLDLIAAVEKAGGWPAFVLAHRRVVVGLVTKCAPLPTDGLVTKCAPLPTDAAAHVASFLWPEGGF